VVRVLLNPGFRVVAEDAAAVESGWRLSVEERDGVLNATFTRDATS
jgi:hypothetical protein